MLERLHERATNRILATPATLEFMFCREGKLAEITNW